MQTIRTQTPGNETIEMRHALRLFLLTLLLVTSSTYVSTQTTSRTVSQSEQQVLNVESSRMAAMVQADTKQLNLVLAEDLTYTHSSGKTDTKAELLASITSGNLKYE